MRTLPPASCTLKFRNLPTINSRTTWHRERLKTSFGGKTQEELELELKGNSEYIKKLELCVQSSAVQGINVSHVSLKNF